MSAERSVLLTRALAVSSSAVSLAFAVTAVVLGAPWFVTIALLVCAWVFWRSFTTLGQPPADGGPGMVGRGGIRS